MSAHRRGSRREVAKLAGPLAVGMLSFTLMGVTDTLLMGKVGTVAQAGVGLAAIITFALGAFFRGMTAGSQSLVAAADGAQNPLRMSRAGSAAALIGLFGGILLAGITWLVGRYAMLPLTNDPAVAAEAGPYLVARAMFQPVSLVGWGLMSALQGVGDTRSRMWASLIGNAVNVVLDLVLIFGIGPIPALGAVGAAWATNIGEVAMLVVYGIAWRRRFGRLVFPGREVLRSSMGVGLPAGLQWAQGTFAFALMTVVLARVGATHLAASQIVLQVVSVSFLPGYAIGEASGVLVGRYLGARRSAGAARAVRSGRTLAWVMMGACGVIFAFFGRWIGDWFTDDPAVLALIVELMFWAAAFQLIDAAATVQICALRGAGDTNFTLCVGLFGSWGLLVPLTFAFALGLDWGAPGAYLALTVELLFLAIVTAVRTAGLVRGKVGRLDLLLGER